jgi:hypothetical protein
MKKFFLAALMMLSVMGAGAQSFTRSGNTFAAVATTRTKAEPRKTVYTYKDTDGKTYPIYIGKTGSCFIIRTSKNGNEYRKYLGQEISSQICKEMGIEYKPKNK